MVTTPAPATRHVTSGSRINAVCSSEADERRGARQQVDRTLAQVVGGGAVVREHGELPHDAEPDRVRATARVDHRVAQHGCARAGRRSTRTLRYPGDDRLEQRGVLERRAQVQRRSVGDVHEAGVAHAP